MSRGPHTAERVDMQALMMSALAMELRAAERYTEFADVLGEHNNREVAALFRTLAEHEAQHAQAIRTRMGWDRVPPADVAPDAPEAPPLEDAHYLMQPWHVLKIALDAERSARDFFASIVSRCEAGAVRDAASELMGEEEQHVRLLEGWLARVPPPPENWADDPDPPRYNE